MQNKIDKFTKLLDARKLNNTYEPDNKRPTTAYDSARSKGDTVGMIKALFKN
ncbi:hypothetical protein D3C79_1089030 [compost metagenome]